jgi:hypothetical protein
MHHLEFRCFFIHALIQVALELAGSTDVSSFPKKKFGINGGLATSNQNLFGNSVVGCGGRSARDGIGGRDAPIPSPEAR